jgi:hypothetical protein
MFVYCECCVLSGRGLCDELITCPEESYRLWCVIVCDLEISRMGRPWPALGRSATKKNGFSEDDTEVEIHGNQNNKCICNPQTVRFVCCIISLNRSSRYWNPDRQCTYNVTLWRLHATIFAVENQYVLHRVRVCL